MAAKLLDEKVESIDELTLIPSDGGRFEVEVDGNLVWSKKKTKEFPEFDDIAKALGG